ncbi:MAG: radical SAM protein [Clostridiaceae bacterium]|jgi:histone acetyltransferase (RNA polymerase elongator complex component)|nr:radical SAM protein [Clostridiaceae bacterium]
MKDKRHINIPIFIPHSGCPHSCVFCNQRKISGHSKSPEPEQIKETVEKYLDTVGPEDTCEIAFFGGSFTGITIADQKEYLNLAESFVKKGFVSGIRLSTRPDYINKDILDFLGKYSVKVIELGIQSLDKEVLQKSSRLYTPEEAINACYLVKKSGFSLGIQTMIGLPGDTFEKSLKTAEAVVAIKPDMVRIYPTLVVKDTGLEELYMNKNYRPLSLDEAVLWCSKLVQIYESAGITVLRIGLHDAAGLEKKDDIIAGPVHPAFGELVYSGIWLDKICNELLTYGNIQGRGLNIYVSPSKISQVTGYNRKNIKYLKERFNFSKIRVLPNMDKAQAFRIELNEES